MAPTPQEMASLEPDVIPADKKKVVISGISGLYPACHDVKEFSNILYNKVDPISTNVRWKYVHPEISPYVGNVPGLNKFDAQFFKVHYRLGNSMDSMSRKILEQTYQAIFDAGLSPELLSTKRVGVFIGTCSSESEKASFYLASTRTGFGILGCSRTMYANRVSYWLNLKGPSMAIDEVCCSSSAALEHAYLAISRGDCDAAIVGGSSLCLHPQTSVHYGRMVTMCEDGKTKCFDENADGSIKTEAIVVLYLQKAEDALRIYAELVHVKSRLAAASITTCVTGQEYGFVRNPIAYEKFLKTFYTEANVAPEKVEYIEALGTAVPKAEKIELDVISKVFCEGRTDPLYVGSVMSNVGYTEAASAVVALSKILLGYHKGELAANMHFTSPRKDVPALQDGRMRVVSEHQPFGRTYTAITNMSITGCTAHLLLHGHYKPKDLTKYQCSIPRLVTISGRHEGAAKKILDDLKSRPIDPEELALLHNVHTKPIAGHLGKAFTILDTNAEQKTVSLVEACEYFDNAPRPLWFVYSGMGSQWAGMGTQLMRIPIFAAAIERCQKVLQPKGVDLVHIITAPDKTIFDNILNSFVGIAAIQIGLTDVLKELGLVPDKIIGHSVGELGCAYADGCFTAEEMILSAYSRGLVSVETPFIRGSMAAVGVGYNEIKDMVPPEIEVACHNAAESSTISGPADIMKEFVASLSAKGIFAKEVPCSNIAYHSRYIAEAGPGLLKYLSEVIKDPKPRSERWVSTSVPQDRWDEPAAKYSSAEYHTNNLLNPVLFEETSKLIPANAVLVEIAPHGLLQAILKRSLPASCKHIPLTRRGHPDNALFLLEAIGKLFMEGYSPQVAVLYPKVEFPVSTGTPMLSHLVEWAHNEKWNLPLTMSASHQVTAILELIISVHDAESNFLRGHVIREKTTYPFAAALVAAWDTLAMSINEPKRKLTVKFSDVQLFVQPTLHEQTQLRLTISLHRGTGRFEILNESSKVATGYVQPVKPEDLNAPAPELEELQLTSEDVYQMFYEREYSYSGEFRSIQSANPSLTKAYIEWSNNWVTLIDGFLQLNALREDHHAVSQPRRIRNMVVDVREEAMPILDYNGKKVVEVCVDDVVNTTRCGGNYINNVAFTNLPASPTDNVILNQLNFVPHFNSNLDAKSALQVFLQIVSQNVNKEAINVVEIQNFAGQDTIFNAVKDFSDAIPGLKVQFNQIKKEDIQQDNNLLKTNVDLVLVQNLNMDDSIFEFLYNILPRNTFVVISEESSLATLRTRPSALYQVVSSQNTGDLTLHLSHWRPNTSSQSVTAFTVRSREDFSLLSTTRDSLPPTHKLLILTSYPPVDGIKDLVAKWRKDSEKNQVFLLMINYNTASDQDLDLAPELNLAFNVLNNSVWGGEYYLPLVPKETKLDNMTLTCETIGDLSSLRWVEAPQPDDTNKGITVDVHYASLNTLDAKRATGVYVSKKHEDNANSYGMDFSGVTPSGTKVMGIVPTGACSKRVRAATELVWPVPEHWTMEEAATVPLPYAHAFYCLMVRTMWPQVGHSILVHGGAGALGQAAISISLAHGLRVFATVSDLRKKHFLRKMFPELKDDDIGCSRDHTFGDMINILTNGQGVDRVLNCIPGDLKNISLQCTKAYGIVIDTVQLPSNDDFFYGMYNMTKERNYLAVDFSSLLATNNKYDLRKIQLLISEGISRGYVRPLSRVTFPTSEAARALRLLEASRHRGRVLLRLVGSQHLAYPSIKYSSQNSHLIVSNDTVLGLQLTDRLVDRGARTLQVLVPSVPALALRRQASWEKLGAKVTISSEDLGKSKNVESALTKHEKNSVEAVYLIATKVSENKLDSDVVKTLDKFARKQTNTLKYFAVVSDDQSFGNETCYSRAKDHLPATKLCLPSIKQISSDSQEVAVNWRQVLDGLEHALRSAQPVVHAHSLQVAQPSILEKIAAITGIEISEDSDETNTLGELGVTTEQAETIRVLLRDERNLWLNEETILSLTVQKIKELQHMSVNHGLLKDAKGLDVFFSYVDTDELMASINMVFLSTLTSKGVEEFDVNQKYLCIVPGLEGNYERFKELSERLKVPAVVLQPSLDRPHNTVRETAEELATTLLKKARIQNNFLLLGYESGILIALELAAILEERGLTGTVFCIGSSPEEIKATLEDELKEFTSETALQEAVIRHLFSLMMGVKSDFEFKEGSTWQEKVETCVRALQVPLSAQYARAYFEAAYEKIVQVRQYKPELRPLRSNIVVLRANSNQPIASPDPMQQYSEQPIVVHDLKVPLANSLKDMRCASIINQHLHPDILTEFETKNLCERFAIKSVIFCSPEEIGVEIE